MKNNSNKGREEKNMSATKVFFELIFGCLKPWNSEDRYMRDFREKILI